MSKTSIGIAAGLVLAALAGAGAAAKEDRPIGQVIEAGHRMWIQALVQGDAKAAAQVYAPKAAIFPPNNHRIEGREAIQAEFAAMGKVKFEIQTVEAKQSAGTAWCSGTYKVILPDGRAGDVGKFVEIWTETDQGWKLWRDIWNSDNPPQAAKPAGPAQSKP